MRTFFTLISTLALTILLTPFGVSANTQSTIVIEESFDGRRICEEYFGRRGDADFAHEKLLVLISAGNSRGAVLSFIFSDSPTLQIYNPALIIMILEQPDAFGVKVDNTYYVAFPPTGEVVAGERAICPYIHFTPAGV